jgi:hypothetical protein
MNIVLTVIPKAVQGGSGEPSWNHCLSPWINISTLKSKWKLVSRKAPVYTSVHELCKMPRFV